MRGMYHVTVNRKRESKHEIFTKATVGDKERTLQRGFRGGGTSRYHRDHFQADSVLAGSMGESTAFGRGGGKKSLTDYRAQKQYVEGQLSKSSWIRNLDPSDFNRKREDGNQKEKNGSQAHQEGKRGEKSIATEKLWRSR